MPTNLDNFLSALATEGAKLKRKRGRPKGIPSLTTHGKTSEPRKINLGSFEPKAVIASYLKRYCTQCGYSEIAAIPRLFVLKQNKRKSTTRIYTRIQGAPELTELLHHLPLKTVLYPEPSPGCKYCLQETNDNAKSKKRQRENQRSDRPRPPGEASPLPTGVVPTEPDRDSVQTRGSQPVHNSLDQPRLVRAGETFDGESLAGTDLGEPSWVN